MRALTMLAASAAIAAAAGAAWAQPQPQPPPSFPTFPLSVGIASENGSPVIPAGWLEAQVARANEIYRPHGVQFALTAQRPIDTRHARLETRADRHALGVEMQREVINVFVVAAMRDVDDPTLYRMGVHWRPRARAVPRGAHFVIVTATAMPSTLAHELGHFFGNGHSQTTGNLMSYSRGTGLPFLDEPQVRRVHQLARRFLRTREIVPRSAS